MADLSTIPNAIDTSKLVAELKTPKQHFPEAHKAAEPKPAKAEAPDPAIEKPAASTPPAGDEKPDTDNEIRERDHKHAAENAEIITWILTLAVGFVLAKMIDTGASVKDYEFDEEESASIRKGWEIFFRSLEKDYRVPGILAPLFPMGMAIYAKADQAFENRKAKKKAGSVNTYSHPAQITDIQRQPTPPMTTAAGNGEGPAPKGAPATPPPPRKPSTRKAAAKKKPAAKKPGKATTPKPAPAATETLTHKGENQ